MRRSPPLIGISSSGALEVVEPSLDSELLHSIFPPFRRHSICERREPSAQAIALSDFVPSHAVGAVAHAVIGSIFGTFGTMRRTDLAFAISRLCAGNPASPQSVPASVLLNFFMPAFLSSRWNCDVITLHLSPLWRQRQI